MSKVFVIGEKHLSIPNIPRHSRHQIIRPKTFPFGRFSWQKIWRPLKSFSYLQSLWGKLIIENNKKYLISNMLFR